MRVLNVLFAALVAAAVVVAGLFAAAVIATTAAVALLVRRFRHRSAPLAPATAPPAPRSENARRSTAATDAIDITATEVS